MSSNNLFKAHTKKKKTTLWTVITYSYSCHKCSSSIKILQWTLNESVWKITQSYKAWQTTYLLRQPTCHSPWTRSSSRRQAQVMGNSVYLLKRGSRVLKVLSRTRGGTWPFWGSVRPKWFSWFYQVTLPSSFSFPHKCTLEFFRGYVNSNSATDSMQKQRWESSCLLVQISLRDLKKCKIMVMHLTEFLVWKNTDFFMKKIFFVKGMSLCLTILISIKISEF